MLGLGIDAVEEVSLQLGSGGVSKAHTELAGEGRSYLCASVSASTFVSGKRRMAVEDEHRQVINNRRCLKALFIMAFTCSVVITWWLYEVCMGTASAEKRDVKGGGKNRPRFL